MVHQGGSGGNMARPSTPSDHLAPSFPTPTTIGAQPILALFQENQCDASIGAGAPQLGHPSAADTLQVPPAVAAQTFYYLQPENHQPHRTMPQAGVPNAMPLQHFSGSGSGTEAAQPLHGTELAARVAAATNTLPPQPFQPNNYAHGWSQSQAQAQAQLLQQQAPPAPRYAALQPVEPGDDSGNPLPPPPQDAHILQHPMVAMAPNNNSAAPLVAAYGGYGATSWARPMLPPSDWPGSWAPPVQQPGGAGGQASSWAWAPPAQKRPGMPAASPTSGSAQTQPPPVMGKKTFEEFLLEAGVLDQQTLDRNFLDEFAEEMLGDEQAELDPVERDDRLVSLEDVLLALGLGAGSSSGAGPSRHQVRLPVQPEEALGAGATGGCGRDQAAAAEARERRSRRMAKRKEAAARARHHRPDKHAAPRGSQNGPGAI